MQRAPHFLLALFLFACSSDGHNDGPSPDRGDEVSPSDITLLERFEVSSLNQDLDPATPTVDLNFYITKGSGSTWARLENAVLGARDIYEKVGVQIRVGSAIYIDVPSDWQKLDPSILDEPSTTEFVGTDLYRQQDEMQRRLAPRTEAIFDAILSFYEEEKTGVPIENALHIATIDNAPISFYDFENGEWNLGSVGTSALSFPPYMFAERMPLHMRGIITMSSQGAWTLAHEMGHNMINISHEGIGQCPAFAVQGDDLMLYGGGTRIPSGLEGRWQQERLQLSPFLYTVVDGERVFENEFLDGGRYHDPLYGRFMFDVPCSPPDADDEFDDGIDSDGER